VLRMRAMRSSSRFVPPTHRARSFAKPPDAGAAAGLLAKLAGATCAFSPAPADRPLALYGAGNLGRLARDFLMTVGHVFVMAIDCNARLIARQPYWSGVPVFHPEEVTKTAKDELRVAVSIVTSPYVPVERSLLALGYLDIVPFYDLAESFRSSHPLSNGWFAPPLTAIEQKNAAEVLAHWHDDISRAHHLQFLAWRRLREEWQFAGAPISMGNRFFIPEVAGVLDGNEFLLDAGAHHGSVTEAFVRQTRGAFQRIALIEPDPGNRQRLEERLRSWLPDDERVALYDHVLAEEEAEALFHDGLDYASQISPTGKRRVTTRTLDTLELWPTFVKLHLEGAELAALKGARKTLVACRPIVAATVYHNADGVWRTPLWLMQTLQDYRFLFRCHGWCGTGAVVYAIPSERWTR